MLRVVVWARVFAELISASTRLFKLYIVFVKCKASSCHLAGSSIE